MRPKPFIRSYSGFTSGPPQGKPLKNREAFNWFRERYDDAFSRRKTTSPKKTRQASKPSAASKKGSSTQRHGEPWTKKEDAASLKMDADNITPAEIAKTGVTVQSVQIVPVSSSFKINDLEER